jgi:hypothetical protein
LILPLLSSILPRASSNSDYWLGSTDVLRLVDDDANFRLIDMDYWFVDVHSDYWFIAILLSRDKLDVNLLRSNVNIGLFDMYSYLVLSNFTALQVDTAFDNVSLLLKATFLEKELDGSLFDMDGLLVKAASPLTSRNIVDLCVVADLVVVTFITSIIQTDNLVHTRARWFRTWWFVTS